MTRAFEAVSPFDSEPTGVIRLPRSDCEQIDLAALRRSPIVAAAIDRYRSELRNDT